MSDDLVTRLRRLSPTLDMLECEDVLQAADRLERLEGKLAEAREKRMEEAAAIKNNGRYGDDWLGMTCAILLTGLALLLADAFRDAPAAEVMEKHDE